MIERIHDMPAGTLGFRVSGRIQRADYTDVLEPALRNAVDQGAELRSLYVIDRLERMDPGALWEDAKTGVDVSIARHAAWRRTAVLTDQGWLADAARLFGWMVPGEFRVFPLAELDQAKAWVATEGLKAAP